MTQTEYKVRQLLSKASRTDGGRVASLNKIDNCWFLPQSSRGLSDDSLNYVAFDYWEGLDEGSVSKIEIDTRSNFCQFIGEKLLEVRYNDFDWSDIPFFPLEHLEGHVLGSLYYCTYPEKEMRVVPGKREVKPIYLFNYRYNPEHPGHQYLMHKSGFVDWQEEFNDFIVQETQRGAGLQNLVKLPYIGPFKDENFTNAKLYIRYFFDSFVDTKIKEIKDIRSRISLRPISSRSQLENSLNLNIEECKKAQDLVSIN